MNLKQFKYVITLAETGSFGRAAEELGISQPSLSQYVKKIEMQLGDVELFDRSGGNVRLTDAGKVYIETGRKILDLERQMLGQLNDIAVNKSGAITVGTSPYRSASMMPAVVKEFKNKYPGMHIVVEEMTSQELLEATEHGKFDLCLTMLPVNERTFCYERIANEELMLAVPTSFDPIKAEVVPDRKHPAIDVSQIDRKPFVMITEGQYMQQALENLCNDNSINVTKVVVVKSLEAQVEMVRAGLGMALLPSGIERFFSPGEAMFYSFKQSLPRREIVAMWRRECAISNVARDLISVMKNVFSN